MERHSAPIDRVEATALVVPTDAPEADGTLAWDSTTLVIARARAGGLWGLGYAYTDRVAAELVARLLAPAVQGRNALDVTGSWQSMRQTVRNLGYGSVVASAVAALDCALWDLKARLLGLPLLGLLGMVREAVPAYGSGGCSRAPPGPAAACWLPIPPGSAWGWS